IHPRHNGSEGCGPNITPLSSLCWLAKKAGKEHLGCSRDLRWRHVPVHVERVDSPWTGCRVWSPKGVSERAEAGMTAVADITEESTSRWIEAGGMRTHYHDVGEGPPIIMLHAVGPGGVTAWITFRNVLAQLAERHRCIAIDMPNFAKTGP